MDGTPFPRLAKLERSADHCRSALYPPRRCATGDIHYRTARSRADLQGAFGLLQRRYQQAGLAANDGRTMRIMPYQLSPTSQVLIATQANRVVGTVTVVAGRPQSLPLASSYPRAMAQLQTSAAKLGEITSLAIDPTTASCAEVFVQLSRLVTYFAREQGMEHLVAVVHPRHSRFYQHVLGFDVIGNELPCQLVGGHPGVAVLGYINELSRVAPAWRPYYSVGQFDGERLHASPMTTRDRNHFARFVTRDQRRAA